MDLLSGCVNLGQAFERVSKARASHTALSIAAKDIAMVRARWHRIWKERTLAGYTLRELGRNWVIAYLPSLAGRIAQARMER